MILLGSCRTEDLTSNKESFSVVPSNTEILKSHFTTLLNSKEVPICVANLDTEGKFRITESMWEYWISDALDQWMQAMQASPFAQDAISVPLQERLRFTHTKKPCEDAYQLNPKSFSVQFFPDVQIAEKYFCTTMKDNKFARSAFTCGSMTQFSAGEQHTRSISILPVVGTRTRPVSDFARTITHEFGHLFGLFDSYKMPPRVDFDGPPPKAVMAYTNDRVTTDDTEGIAVAMRWAFEGKIDCGEHKNVRNKGFYPKILYCELNPTREPQKSHAEYFSKDEP